MSQTIIEAIDYASGAHDACVPRLLRLVGITKIFPGVVALDDVSFDLKAGEVHVLFGENGAGKSTMISILAGAHRPTEGKIEFEGKGVKLNSVYAAREHGISAVFQEFSLVPQMTVEQNLFLGSEVCRNGFLQKRELHQRAVDIIEKLKFTLNANQKVEYLSRAEQQMVEIAKAFRSKLSVLILDEPTASLTERETEQLFNLIEKAKSEGVGIIYITHRMAEIKRIADRITVLRDGKYIATVDADDITENQLLKLMTGRVIDHVFPKIEYNPRKTILEVNNLVTKNNSVKNVSIKVKQGEIIGIAGLVGAGKSEIARACYGLEKVVSGEIIFDGKRTTHLKPRAMLDRGVFYVPPDRREEGLVMMRNVRENIALPSLALKEFSGRFLLRRTNEKEIAIDLASRLKLHPLNIEKDVGHFSGGNQQKVLLARSLTRDVKLFIFDEPTVGVDVGARVAIYEFIRDLCESGAAILLISSDLPEILHLTNRAYVMHRGVLNGELHGEAITEKNVLSLFFDKE